MQEPNDTDLERFGVTRAQYERARANGVKTIERDGGTVTSVRLDYDLRTGKKVVHVLGERNNETGIVTNLINHDD